MEYIERMCNVYGQFLSSRKYSLLKITSYYGTNRESPPHLWPNRLPTCHKSNDTKNIHSIQPRQAIYTREEWRTFRAWRLEQNQFPRTERRSKHLVEKDLFGATLHATKIPFSLYVKHIYYWRRLNVVPALFVDERSLLQIFLSGACHYPANVVGRNTFQPVRVIYFDG